MTSDNTAPIITERLVLTPPTLKDFVDCTQLWGDPSVTRYISGDPLSVEAAWAKFLRSVGHWAALGFGYWVVREKATGVFVGEVGFGRFKRNITPAFNDTPEIGWVLMPAFHGLGYATDAVSAALAWADQHLSATRTVCLIDPDNTASIRLANKMGYREFDRANYHDEMNILFERGSNTV